MAISFLSDRKRPVVVVVVSVFLLLSSLFLLFSPAPSSLPSFFSSPSSHISSSSLSSPIAASRAPQTPIPVSADASPPQTTVGASDGRRDGAAVADLPQRDTAAHASPADRGAPPPAAVEASASMDTNETAAAVSIEGGGDEGGEVSPVEVPSWEVCEVGKSVEAADYIPCLDNVKAVKALKSLRHMEHRERHCPTVPRPRCLVPLPAGYRLPVPWPRSRDMVRMPACFLR